MLSNYFTILIVPQKEGRVLRFQLSEFLLKLFLFVVGLLFMVSLGIFYDYMTIRGEGDDQELYNKELMLLETFKLQDIYNRLNERREELRNYEAFDRKLRLMTGLQDYGTTIQYVREMDNPLVDEKKAILDGKWILTKLRELDLDIKTREISFFQLEAFLQESKDRLARTPSIAPTTGYISSRFGIRSDPFTRKKRFHKGLDWANRPYTPIYAPADGVVVNTFINGGFGMFLVIDHGYDIITRYGHLAKYEVTAGDKVKRGDLIARMGNTGRSTANHLHYEVLVRDQHVNPMKYILNLE